MPVLRRPAGDGWLWIAGSLHAPGGDSGSFVAEVERAVGRIRQAIVLTANAIPAPDMSDLRSWMGGDIKSLSISGPGFPSLAAIEMAFLIGGEIDVWLDAFAESEAEDALLESLGRGMHIMAAGAAAEAMGSWAWSPRGEEYVGALGWLPGAIVVAREAASDDWGPSRDILVRRRRAYALAVHPGNLVGLGPRGEVQLSGDPAPRLLLGPGWAEAEGAGGRRPSSLERP